MKRIFSLIIVVTLGLGSSAALADEPKSLAAAIFALGEKVCPEVADPVRQADCLGETLQLATRAIKLETRQTEIWAAVVNGDQEMAAAVKTELLLGIDGIVADVEAFAEKYAASR